MSPRLNAQPNYSVIDGIAVLQALATSEHPIGGRELARRLDMEPTRANRLLKTLNYMGIARQTENRKYTAGPGMYVLAAQSLFASGFIRGAIPQLRALRESGLTVALGVLWKDTVSYLYHAPPGLDSLQAIGRIGAYPATKGGIGMVLLATHPKNYLDQLFAEQEIEGFETLSELHDQLDVIRKNEFAFVKVGERLDRHTLAVTVGNPAHAAIGLSGEISNDQVNELVEKLRQSALEISRSSALAECGENLDLGINTHLRNQTV